MNEHRNYEWQLQPPPPGGGGGGGGGGAVAASPLVANTVVVGIAASDVTDIGNHCRCDVRRTEGIY